MKKQETLSLDDTRQLLNGYGLHEGSPLGDLWVAKCRELHALEGVVNDYLRQGSAPALVARGLSRDLRKKGMGRLVLEGSVDGRLHLTFQRGPSTIPTMKELRARARAAGVNIAGLGTRRKDILALLDQKSQIQPDQVSQVDQVESVLQKMRGPNRKA